MRFRSLVSALPALPVLSLLAALTACSGTSSSPGGPCQSNRDCVRGESCISGQCEVRNTMSGPQCTSDVECAIDQVCDQLEQKCKPILINNAPDATTVVAADSGVVEMGDSGVVETGDSGVAEMGDTGTAPLTCTNDPECGAQPAMICMSNQCMAGCTVSGGLTCTGGQVCDPAGGHCVPPSGTCANDPECGAPARICVNNTCVAGCATDTALCTAGAEVCNTNTGRCVPVQATCAIDSDCGPPARVCESTQCVPGCSSPGGVQCSGATSLCNAGNGRCEAPPGPPPCSLDADCMDATLMCVSTVCVPRCDQPLGACTGGQVCNPGTGRCLPGALPLGDACTVDAQCVSRSCLGLTIGGTSMDICSDPCGASSNCPLNFACTSVSGMGFCLGEALFGAPPPNFDVSAGGTCSTTVNNCQSGWCNTGTSQCIETCSRTADCASFGNNCYTYEQTGTGASTWDNLCYSPGSGSALGASCSAGSGCLSGICDRYEGVCARQCCSESDCAANQTCSVYDLDAATGMKICIPKSATAGTGGLGSTCTLATDCESETCVPSDPANAAAPSVCSTLCCRNADCASLPGGGMCRPFGGPIAGTLIGACVPN